MTARRHIPIGSDVELDAEIARVDGDGGSTPGTFTEVKAPVRFALVQTFALIGGGNIGLPDDWESETVYAPGAVVNGGGTSWITENGGTSGTAEPDWAANYGDHVDDDGFSWADQGFSPGTSFAYDNGVAGVGATLSSFGNQALVVDHVTPEIGDRVVVAETYDQGNLDFGIYTVTDLGADGGGGRPFVLTRATDCDTAAKIGKLWFCVVEEGSYALAQIGVQVFDPNVTIGAPDFVNFFVRPASAVAAGRDAMALQLSGGTSDIQDGVALGRGTVAQVDGTAVGNGAQAVASATAVGTGAVATLEGSTVFKATALFLSSLPTDDPQVVGQIFADNGVLTVSEGPP